jgi:CRISPR-associated endonuclease/helicase Cas3
LGNIIASHHGYLYDSLASDGETPLFDKLNELASIPAFIDVDFDIDMLVAEFKAIVSLVPEKEKAFSATMLIKLFYSCLVDADRLDAYHFDSGKQYLSETPDWSGLLQHLEGRLAGFNNVSEMGKLRQRVSDACAKAGKKNTGIYKLEVPTGGGKTLSSLRFALEHARTHELDRIIYVIPNLSILSQAAKEIRLALGADENTVLEHHSDFFSADDYENYKLHTDRFLLRTVKA